MAFEVIDLTDLDVGKPTKRSIWVKTKNSLDDLNSRTGSLETGASKVELFVSEIVGLQQYITGGALERIMFFRASRDLRITNAQIYILASSTGTLPTSGTLEFDIRVGNTPATLATVFNVKPTVTTFAEGDTNGAVDFIVGGEDILQGQWIALDITNLQQGQSRIFIDIFSEPS